MVITVKRPPKADAPPAYVESPARRFLASLPVDRRLYRHDVVGSIAHVEMLGAREIITPSEAKALATGLRRIYREIESGHFPWRDDLEDVHTNIEARLTESLGRVGGKVHTARSRNDQIALDERLWLREAICHVQSGILRLQTAIAEIAERHVETVMPGYTHLQRAQPVSLAHHLLAHFWRLTRDFDRLHDCLHRANVSPLGAGALAGSTLPIDPNLVAQRLGFTAVFENSIDAVSDRDYFAEFVFDLSLLAVHLSSLGEELVHWASSEFGFLEPSAALGGGSSLMPQKRNPDVAELARGKAARVEGDLIALLSALKSLPLAYNRDLQEDKAPVFDATGHVLDSLDALSSIVPTLSFDKGRMAEAASDPRLLATDLAEYLVTRGVPFREAHEIVAGYFSAPRGGPVTAKSLQGYNRKFGTDVTSVVNARTSLRRRTTWGGPGPASVRGQIQRARDVLGLEQYSLSKSQEILDLAETILKEESN